MSAPAPMLRTSGLSVTLGGRTVLSNADLVVREGEFVVVIGPNGAGKTTLLKAIGGLLPGSGEIAIGDVPLAKLSLAERARQVAYLPQGHVFHWPLPVEEIVALGRLPRGRGADLSSADQTAVARAMAATGMTEYAGRAVTGLSGGERARVALARVLATEAPLVLADEPTASLDPRYQLLVLDILRRHAASGGAVVAVLHDLALAVRHADRLVILDNGRIVADGTPQSVLTPERLVETFGVGVRNVSIDGIAVPIPWSIA